MARLIAAVALAAGGSARLGRPKQLLRRAGRSLVQRAAAAAREAGCDPVLVVVGAHAEAVTEELAELPVRIVRCLGWEEGLGASIRAGVEAVEAEAPRAEAVLLLGCDQPLLDARVLRELLARFDGEPGRTVACEYAGTVGQPALFERAHFPALRALRGDAGAKRVLLASGASLVRLSWPAGAADVDRPEDASSWEDDRGQVR